MFKSAWSISAYTVRCCRSNALEYSRSRNAVDQPSVHGKNALSRPGCGYAQSTIESMRRDRPPFCSSFPIAPERWPSG